MSRGFITGLPRSRTHWFAEYFSHYCPSYHEPTNGILSKDELYQMIDNQCVISDSALFITDVFERYPNVPVVVIERDTDDVWESLCDYFESQGLPTPSYDFLLKQKTAVDQIKGLRVSFDEINGRLPEITRHFGFEYDEEWGEALKGVNSQVLKLTANPESYDLWGVFEGLVA